MMDKLDTKQAELGTNWERSFHLYETVIAGDEKSKRIQATFKLGRMSKHAPENILACAIPVLVELLRSPFDNQTPSIHGASAYCLKCIACLGEGRLAVIIGQCGAIPSLLSLLQASESNLQMVILKCLRNMVTFSDSNRPAVVRNGGLEIVLNMLNASPDGLKRPLLEILSALSLLREVRRVLLNSGGLRFLIESAKCGSMASRTRAAQGIGLLGLVKRARRTLVNFGAAAALLDLIQNGDTSAKLVAANALGVISSHVDYIRPVAQAGAIPVYAEILEGCEPLGKEIAEDVFCILAVVEENAAPIFQHLVRILRGSNDEAKAAAADITWHLASYKQLVSVVQDSGAIPALVELLRSGNGDVKEKVSGAIAQFSYNKSGRVALADSGVIPLLIQMLEDESQELRENAAEALVNFSEDPSLGDRVSCVLDSPLFQDTQDKLMQIRASDARLDSSLRLLSIEHLTLDPSLS
ncbi:U-box domain-containing protein 2 [Coffea eugenioides]|uniref:U-box domain-containing protein 2 n=1 Tax=Coffea eugenioides TaxID=49369 RepID=UPI000F60A3A0|nr:U-box domain-containing protein 2 [Coffea eugenioides]XP_027171009.1 U-box domain-containing protein 2 [Coffea eugenioides]